MKDLSLPEILFKKDKWKRGRQRLVLSTLDIATSKILCSHCLKKVKKRREQDTSAIQLAHRCSMANARDKNGDVKRVNSSVFNVHKWCPDKANCKSGIQIFSRNEDIKKHASWLSPAERDKEMLSNLNFSIQKIICVHCDQELLRLCFVNIRLNGDFKKKKTISHFKLLTSRVRLSIDLNMLVKIRFRFIL
jgi:hypothetical protein